MCIRPQLPTARDFLEAYLDWYKAEHPTTPGKAKSEVPLFIACFGHRPIDTMRPMEMESYKTDRPTKSKVVPETVGKEVRGLQAALRRGVRWMELDFNPLEKTQSPRGVRGVAVRFYTADAMQQLYAANAARANLWRFMAHTGIRRGDPMHLRHENLVAVHLLVESDPGEEAMGARSLGSGGRFD
ncbi:TPA: hypothetical protein ACKP4S_000360 [Stenotrophomonas maltophilia]|uniref:hypothetical protein n=1 Tax=Stenotrophomonas sp. SMYL86 TaxID=3076044 RepID=UPI00130FE7D5|nr:hypothetical protein [Stenotrophomonas sp. SMYL86]